MWPPTGLIPWFSKTEGNTYATLLHHPFLFKGKPTQCSRGSKKDFWHRCRGVYAQVKTYQVPITNSYHSHYIICHLPLVFLSPTSPLPFYSPPLFRLLVVMASPLSTPLSPEFEVFHFKQRQGENLKDAWLRIMESHHNCTSEINLRILLRNFYVGLNLSHRQLLDCATKGNFIEIDPHIAHEIIEGIVGTLPQQKGPHHTQENTQVFEKICKVTKILQ